MAASAPLEFVVEAACATQAFDGVPRGDVSREVLSFRSLSPIYIFGHDTSRE